MTHRRLVALVLVWTLPSLFFLVTAAFVYTVYRIDPPDRLDDAERAAVMTSLRAGLDAQPEVPCTVTQPIDGTLIVTVWSRGQAIVRIDGTGNDVAAAVA